jgi:3-oxoacyl-[acyl-carrier-protein] synthase-3
MIPAGGLRLPGCPETAVLEDAGDGNLRAKDHLRMDGSAVFNFVQTEVPEMIENLLATVGVSLEKVDYILSHQPNKFMLEKLADKIKLPHAKMPSNIVEHFGNSSGVTIPMAITYNLSAHLRQSRSQVVFAGYGVGLTWSAMLLELGGLKFCEMIEYP